MEDNLRNYPQPEDLSRFEKDDEGNFLYRCGYCGSPCRGGERCTICGSSSVSVKQAIENNSHYLYRWLKSLDQGWSNFQKEQDKNES